MNLHTDIKIDSLHSPIHYTDHILLLGSCFADEIGSLLDFYRFRVSVNPFGTLYNPASVISALERLASRQEFTTEDLVENQGIYATFFHHSDYADTDPDRFLSNANTSLRDSADFFQKANTVIITLGTARIYRHIEKDIIVSNCRKMPASLFRQELLDVTRIVGMLKDFICRFPDKKYILTVSPVRHLKDGAHGNQISKAILLLAVEKLRESFADAAKEKPLIYYFPAYEIMMDELRDYRFYADDMLHPSPLAVRYIFERFRENCIAPEDYPLMQRVENLEKRLRHKLLFPDSDASKSFREKLLRDEESLEKEYPCLSRRALPDRKNRP